MGCRVQVLRFFFFFFFQVLGFRSRSPKLEPTGSAHTPPSIISSYNEGTCFLSLSLNLSLSLSLWLSLSLSISLSLSFRGDALGSTVWGFSLQGEVLIEHRVWGLQGVELELCP